MMHSTSTLRLLYVALGLSVILGIGMVMISTTMPGGINLSDVVSREAISSASHGTMMGTPQNVNARVTQPPVATQLVQAEAKATTLVVATPVATQLAHAEAKATTPVVATSVPPNRVATPRFFNAGQPLLDSARDTALSVLLRDLSVRRSYAVHSAGPGYDAPWIRDSFAWGMIPSTAYPQLLPYTTSELLFWLGQQQPGGQWVSNPQSGFYDETAILICAALDAYRVTGNRALLADSLGRLRKGWAWLKSYASGPDSSYLLWTPVQAGNMPLGPLPVSVDWADQIARRNYAGQVNVLWYRSTRSMAQIEAVLGNANASDSAATFAEHIKTDFNRMFWSVGAVEARNAAAVAPFGHYRSWYPSSRDYFEQDTNFQAVIYGLADATQTQSILDFVRGHQVYLLGTGSGSPPPAKTVYGDYAPEDYAVIRFKIRDGAYHNAYWPSIGALAARAFWQAGDGEAVRRVMLSLAGTFHEGNLSGSAAEWYAATGRIGGVGAYQWSARLFLDALYRAYLGVDADWTNPRGENIFVRPLFGEIAGRIQHLGKSITIRTHGSGTYRRAEIDGHTIVAATVIPESLLHDGSVLDLYLTN